MNIFTIYKENRINAHMVLPPIQLSFLVNLSVCLIDYLGSVRFVYSSCQCDYYICRYNKTTVERYYKIDINYRQWLDI